MFHTKYRRQLDQQEIKYILALYNVDIFQFEPHHSPIHTPGLETEKHGFMFGFCMKESNFRGTHKLN